MRIDLIVNIPGVDYARSWKNRVKSRYGNTTVYFLGLKKLLDSKRAAGRKQDLFDVSKLLRTQRKKKIKSKKQETLGGIMARRSMLHGLKGGGDYYALGSVFAIIGGLVVCFVVPAQGDQPPDPSQYLQKIMIVVESPDAAMRSHIENRFKEMARRYTPRTDMLISSNVMPGLKVLKSEKELKRLAEQEQFDGVLLVTNITVTAFNSDACSGTKKCQLWHTECRAQLYSVTPYRELWRGNEAGRGSLSLDRDKEPLGDIAIRVFKTIQKRKFILPSRYRNQ